MSESSEDTMARLLNECKPYLISAKTSFDLPENLKGDAAGRLQKSIDMVLKHHFESRSKYVCEALDKAFNKA